MPAFQPTADQMRDFVNDPYDGPITQVNLLKFKVKAEYPADHPNHGVDEPGVAAYQRYADAFSPVAAAAGATCLLYGTTERYFIGQGDWDAVLVMHFPSRTAFLEAIGHESYGDAHHHRDAGLLCQELITTHPVVTPL